MTNKLAKNRRSPQNERELIQAYLQQNPNAKKEDGLDVAAVITKEGTRGHGLMSEELNRSRDSRYHRVKNFISDEELKKAIKSKK
ncbi:MAG: hypothetical protein LBK57_09435 [Clostridiales Family XIII bacterium]|jgi:hypothetical protein|nr:hypothetical protein [Clostridiales Family XIII bacterium]